MPNTHFVVVVQLLSSVQLFATTWTAAVQAPLSSTASWSLRKLTSIESVMPSNHLILYSPLLLLPSIFPTTRVFPMRSSKSIFACRFQMVQINLSLNKLKEILFLEKIRGTPIHMPNTHLPESNMLHAMDSCLGAGSQEF